MENKPAQVIDTSKIKVGERYTYDNLCKALNIQPNSKGKQRTNQIKDIRRYVDMEFDFKQNLWQINDIYLYPIPTHVHGNSKYIEYIEYLFLNRLMSMDVNCCVATKNQLYGWLYMVNSKYLELVEQRDSFHRSRQRSIIDSEIGGINYMRKGVSDLSTLGDIFVYRTRKTLSEILNDALKSMADRHVITYRYETVIVEIEDDDVPEIHPDFDPDEDFEEGFGQEKFNIPEGPYNITTRVATLSEERKIDDVKAGVLKKMHFSKESEVMRCNRATEFYQRVNKELYQKYRYLSAYKQYRILFTPDIVTHVLNGLYTKLDSDLDRAILENGQAINQLIVEKMSKPEYFNSKSCRAQALLSEKDIESLLNMVHSKVEIQDFVKEGQGNVKVINTEKTSEEEYQV